LHTHQRLHDGLADVLEVHTVVRPLVSTPIAITASKG
jgi:hypothetical protein